MEIVARGSFGAYKLFLRLLDRCLLLFRRWKIELRDSRFSSLFSVFYGAAAKRRRERADGFSSAQFSRGRLLAIKLDRYAALSRRTHFLFARSPGRGRRGV